MRLLALLCSLTLAELHTLGAQHIARDRYNVLLPPVPRIVSQTRASVALHLFGDVRDSKYRDTAPIDGVDDIRGRRLLQLAERFSPIVRRNNFSVPRDFRDILGPVVPLEIDSWRNGRLERSDTIAIPNGRSQDSGRALQAGQTRAGAISEQAADSSTLLVDRKLLDLIHATSPNETQRGAEPAEGDVERVLFVDMPGDGPASWRRIYSRLDPRRGSHVFVHPFIHEDPATDDARRFQLVFQYWFFYPFNDAINTHEGDWEHINVIVTTTTAARMPSPRSAARALLDSSGLAGILTATSAVDDSLIIAAVDHYFHESVLTLDYLALTDSLRIDAGGAGIDHPHYVWEDLEFARRIVRQRLSIAGGRLATHPFIFVGGNNKDRTRFSCFGPPFTDPSRGTPTPPIPFQACGNR